MDKPMSKIKSIDRNAALRQLTAAITPDGMLGFLRGMPLADEKTIARELMELSGNDFQMISDSVKHLKNNQKAAQETAEVAKEADKVVKQAKAPQKTEKIEVPKDDNATQAPKTQDKKEEKPANDKKVSTEKNAVEKQVKTAPLKPMSKKRYADGLYAAVKKSIKISPQEIKNFIDNIAGEIEKQGIQIEESKTLFGKFNKHVIKESLEFDVIRAAAEKAGITDEDQQIVIGYRLAKMIASDRATDNSGMIPKVFPKDFKILKVPIARATQLIGDSMSDTNKKYWDRQDTERNDALQRMQNPKMQTLKVPVVENPWGAKGNYIPLMMDSPGNIIIQGRDIAQETQDNNDYEYSLPSSLWLLDIDKLKEVISKFEDQRAGMSDVQQDDIQTQHQNRK